ncbi:hypothetical protein ACH5RR_023374 [Cinchona calisaya]|uniref:Protein OBERON 4 n=1 Tax=Cinchona calisaya TaxID=153742 RepID=A0ABD2ZDM1_9GENT
MTRLRSNDELDSFGEKGACKNWGRRDEESGSSHRSLMHRISYYKSESARKGTSSSSSRYDRVEDDHDSSRSVRKRSDYDVDSYDRRKSYDRYRENNNYERGVLSSSPRGGYGAERIYRSESISGFRREVPKGFRSERDRSWREGSASSWGRFVGAKDVDEGTQGGTDSVKVSRLESDDVGKVKSPQRLKDAKSPPWSKDSGSEQTKSIEIRRSEDLPVVSSGNDSEREEGELEPDPRPIPVTVPTIEDQSSDGLQSSQKEFEGENLMEDKHLEDRESSMSAENMESSKVTVQDEQVEGRVLENIHVSTKKADELLDDRNLSQLTNKNESIADNGGSKEEKYLRKSITCSEEVGESQTLKEEEREVKGIDIEDETDGSDVPEDNKGISEETGACLAVSPHVMEEINENLNIKVKPVALSASNCTHLITDEFKSATESRGPMTYTDTYLEGPNTRGLDLFTTSPVRKPEKEVWRSNNKLKDDKLTLDLSLSLPNILLPSGSQTKVQVPGSPTHGRSVQSLHSSFRTDSDGFNGSMSFSGSQYFTHNPSCSLIHNKCDQEQSVKSRPLFQGVDWQALASDEPKNKALPPIVQKLLEEGNGSHHQYETSQEKSSAQALVQQTRSGKGNFRTPVGLERQLSFNKQYPGVYSQHRNDIRSPSQSLGSHETGSGYIEDKKQELREKNGGSLSMMSNPEEREQLGNVGVDFVESIITMIVSEPLNVVAQRFDEMSAQQLAFLKESVCDIIRDAGRQWQLRSFQTTLKSRSNITLEMLLKSHRTHLEILVALKTGLQEFVLYDYDISSSILAEIFLNMRCGNPTCRSVLPVDECDCKICTKKNGFCRDCMCLVCSKFDMASNTCSWVGCDVCLHWCHADCGLRECYIRNGRSATGSEGTTEMQFHCIACDHPSEMFGFVKEVFQTFAKEWTAETLSRELEYVRRIFHSSEDSRGQRLHKIAMEMLSNLENKVNLKEVQKHIMGFLTDTDSVKHYKAPVITRMELTLKSDEKINGTAGPSKEVQWLKSVNLDTSQLDKLTGLFPSLEGSGYNKHMLKYDLHASTPKEHVFDELESIVRIKQAEAKMFQVRADDARKEAEALKRIAASKNERIEEEYTSRITKLRLADAEEMRKQKVEEVQALESAFQDYFHMKMRMENEIKDLLLKMETSRRNLTL